MTTDLSTWGFVRERRAPSFGHAAELSALDEALGAVKKGEARVVSLVGAAGVGKSRLIQDFVLRHSPRVYRGSARDTGAAFGVFAKLLRGRFGLVEGMDGDVAKARVRDQIAAVLDDGKVHDVAYFLGQFVGVPGDESPLTRAVGEEPQQAALIRRAVFKAFLEADAAISPICLVFEDLHEAHDDSLALLRYLIEYLTGPILVICAARPDLLAREEDWGRTGEAKHRVLEVGPLRDAEAAEVMGALLAPCEGGPPLELIRAACAFASGNPLLLEQMVRVYHDTGVLSEVTELGQETRWRVDLEKLSTVTLPVTIEDAVSARLGALDEYETTILEQAAAMGAVFWSGAFVPLQRMGHDAPDLWSEETEVDALDVADALADLVERDYVLKLDESTFPGSDEYVFKHNREREAIHKRTRQSALKRYHQGIADWMDDQEALHSSDEYVAMLAGHREKAGDGLRAGLAYLEAGDVARARYGSSRACEYYQKGLGLLGDAFGGRRIDALHHYGDVLLISGRVDDALAAFREMLTLAYRQGKKSKGGAARNRIGRLYRGTGSLDEAGKHLHAALALFRAVNDERGVASTIDDIGKLHWLRGEYDEALEALRDGLARRRKLADRRSIALSLNNLGTIAQDLRDFPRALALFDEALDVAKQIGDRNRTALVLTNIGEVLYRIKKPDEAIAVLRQAEELCDELGDKLGLAEALRGLGKAYMIQGDLPRARDAIGRAVDLFASVRSKVHLGIALRTLGEITAAGGWGSAHTRSAREYFARAVSIFEQTGNDVELARTFKVYSRFLLDGDAKTDEAVMREALAMNTRAEAIFTRLRITVGPVGELTGRGIFPSSSG